MDYIKHYEKNFNHVIKNSVKDLDKQKSFDYFLKNSWKGMGYARWPALGLTVFSFVAFPLLIL